MSATNLVIESKRLGRACGISVIRKYEKSSDGKMWRVWIEKEMKCLFDGNCFTLTEWEQRLSLPSGMSTWLHAYLASHKEPYPIKIGTIISGAGLTMKTKHHAKAIIVEALDKLIEIDFLASWEIKNDLVTVVRKLS